MVTQYPDTITVETVLPGVRDNDGNFLPGTTVTTSYKGRWETNSKDGYIRGVDGTDISFAGIVYSEVNTPRVPVGAHITVTDRNGIITVTGNALQFYPGQLNSRLWL